MINRNANAIKSESNFDSESHEFTLDANSLGHLMEVLTKLYSNPGQAIVREYITNGIDANIEAGNDDPVILVPPNDMSPELKIIDSGIGMSKSDLINVYSKYGASTKRNTDTQAGMLGLGSKSALAYTHQFIVSSVKQGFRNTVMIHRNNNGGISMTFIQDSVPTDDHSGTTVTIPIKHSDIYRIREYCDWYVMLIGKVQYKRGAAEDKRFFITDKIALLPRKNYDFSSYFVMGNVPYLAGNYTSGTNYRYAYYADMGEFDFEPSREKVMENDKYRYIKQSAVAMLNSPEFMQKIEDHLNSIADMQDRIDEYIRLVKEYGITFTKPEIAGIKTSFGEKIIFLDISKSISYGSHRPETLRDPNTIAIENFNLMRFNKDHLSKIESYSGINGGFNKIVVNPTENAKSLIDPDKIFDWDEVKQIKLDKPKPIRSTKPKVADKNIIRRGSDKAQVYYYFLSEESVWGSMQHKYKSLDAVIYSIRKGDLKAFLREYPNALHVTEFNKVGQKHIAKLTATVTTEEAIFARYLKMSTLKALMSISSQILDKDLIKICERAKLIKDELAVHNYATDETSRDYYKSMLYKKYPIITIFNDTYYTVNNDMLKRVKDYINYDFERNN